MATYGLDVLYPGKKKKRGIVLVKAATAKAAKTKYYGSNLHFKTEGSVVSAKKIPKGYTLEYTKMKKKKVR